jgi:hypothetical protein
MLFKLIIFTPLISLLIGYIIVVFWIKGDTSKVSILDIMAIGFKATLFLIGILLVIFSF